MTESLQLQGQPLRLRLTSHQKSFAMTSKAVRVRSSALWTEADPTGCDCRVEVILPSQPLGSDAAGAKAGPTATEWSVAVGGRLV